MNYFVNSVYFTELSTWIIKAKVNRCSLDTAMNKGIVKKWYNEVEVDLREEFSGCRLNLVVQTEKQVRHVT